MIKLSNRDVFYHGTSKRFNVGEVILPPTQTNTLSEKDRKKNLDKVFFTRDFGSAKIYAGRAKNSLGGEIAVYIVEPIGEIGVLNETAGTSVYYADSAKIIERVL